MNLHGNAFHSIAVTLQQHFTLYKPINSLLTYLTDVCWGVSKDPKTNGVKTKIGTAVSKFLRTKNVGFTLLKVKLVNKNMGKIKTTHKVEHQIIKSHGELITKDGLTDLCLNL